MAGDLIDGFETVLVLGGGNALGAYHLGVCEALLTRTEPAWIVGCSIGAAMGAILLGNPPDTRVERMREFWAQGMLLTVAAAIELPLMTDQHPWVAGLLRR